MLQFAERGEFAASTCTFRLPTEGFCVLCDMTGMGSELAKRLLDAGFRAAKPGRGNELLGIPTLEELIAAVEQFTRDFAFPLSASIPTNGKRIADLLQSTAKSLIGQDMAQPPTKHWQNFGLR
jgi:hypothetical protein